MSEDESHYRSIIFLHAVVPLLRHIVAATPALQRGFVGKEGVVQISALLPPAERVDGNDRVATHLLVDNGTITAVLGPHPSPSLEWQFGSREALNSFFLGKLALPRIRGGLSHPRLLWATTKSLLAMSKLLGATQPPQDPARAELLVTCMFSLLSTGISQLNKAGHPRVRRWTSWQPDRVYAFRVEGRPELGSYIRVKAGKSKAARGEYTRAKPFFAMKFADVSSALGILLETDDMISATTARKIEMEGAPEYGAELGELMFLVAGYAK